MNIPLTTTPINEIQVGDLLMGYEDHGEDAGTAGTYDEAGLADLVSHLRDLLPLPFPWRLETSHEEEGCRLVARDPDTGRTIDSWRAYAALVEEIEDA